METINGNYAVAKIYSEDIEDYAKAQVKMICDDPASEGSTIAIMPDVHPGAIGPIGLSMTVGGKLNSNLVGVDIGCGVRIASLDTDHIDFQKLNKVINEKIPSGFRVRTNPHRYSERFAYDEVEAFKNVKQDRAMLSLGTLGGGNHFIEVDKDGEGSFYLAVHSGSRGFGSQVAEHYNRVGHESLRKRGIYVPYEMSYLEGECKDFYLHDQVLLCEFAELNRQAIVDEISKAMKWKVVDSLDCRHNYIDASSDVPILRKGAISARCGEKVAIPLNMRDGILIGRGLGNEEWNCTAPHGAGRKMKRSDIKNNYTVTEFRETMRGISSPSVNAVTLDESPFAYRDPSVITTAIGDTVTIEEVLVPVYSFKASNDGKRGRDKLGKKRSGSKRHGPNYHVSRK